ncbi:hypothetical protein HanLR1_Chr16g0629141 [Helianthus annuus]|nr:hypothetical protein HanLR1_Chr16g0629141 [Helianthus annuus]
MSNELSYSRNFCDNTLLPIYQSLGDVSDWKFYVNVSYMSLLQVCSEVQVSEWKSEDEDNYSSPVALIGIYISTTSLFCILAMILDLLYAFRNRKFWFPTKYFSLNAASITVIPVALKLLVDLSSPMPTLVDQVAKVGGLAAQWYLTSCLLWRLWTTSQFLQISFIDGVEIPFSMAIIACIYMGMLLFLLMILISFAITIPTAKKGLEFKYQVNSKTPLNEQHPQENLIPTVEKLRQLVKRYLIMGETGNPQFVIANNPLSSASGIICAISMVMYIFMVWLLVLWQKK